MVGLESLVEQMVLLWPHLDRRRGRRHLLEPVQHLPDVKLLHFCTAERTAEFTRKALSPFFLARAHTRARALCLL